jgi:NAD-dependent dihydropyrimidine dehydrogenase PreA subunit
MIANYGYKDGSGEFFIIINTGKCVACTDKPCVKACPESVLEILEDDYDDEVVAVRGEHRNKIKYLCAPCKPVLWRASGIPGRKNAILPYRRAVVGVCVSFFPKGV